MRIVLTIVALAVALSGCMTTMSSSEKMRRQQQLAKHSAVPSMGNLFNNPNK